MYHFIHSSVPGGDSKNLRAAAVIPEIIAWQEVAMRAYAPSVILTGSRDAEKCGSASTAVPSRGYPLLRFQAQIGNRAVERMLRQGLTQPPVQSGSAPARAIQRDDDPDPQDGTDLFPPRRDPLTSPGARSTPEISHCNAVS
jgi:hypothetical protein